MRNTLCALARHGLTTHYATLTVNAKKCPKLWLTPLLIRSHFRRRSEPVAVPLTIRCQSGTIQAWNKF